MVKYLISLIYFIILIYCTFYFFHYTYKFLFYTYNTHEFNFFVPIEHINYQIKENESERIFRFNSSLMLYLDESEKWSKDAIKIMDQYCDYEYDVQIPEKKKKRREKASKDNFLSLLSLLSVLPLFFKNVGLALLCSRHLVQFVTIQSSLTFCSATLRSPLLTS